MRVLRRVILFTSSNVNEPRGVKHANLVAALNPQADIEFIDMSPRGTLLPTPRRLTEPHNVRRLTCFVPHRRAGIVRATASRALTRLARVGFARTGMANIRALSPTAAQLRRFVMARPRADMYIGHNIDALPVLAELSGTLGVPTVFDSMELYSDMGLSSLEGEIARSIERKFLPRCSLVLTSSEEMSSELERAYGLRGTLALYNAPPTSELPATSKPQGLALYWRNTVIGFGARGLDDVIDALAKVPGDVVLHLQGGHGPATDAVRARVRERGLEARVVFHGAYEPHEAIAQAARFHVGLCLERDVCGNHRVTVSNKLFDYMMAGLAVIVSDLPGLSRVVKRSNAGLLYRPGDVDALAACICRLHDEKALLSQFSAQARAFAVSEGNEAHELAKLEAGLRSLEGAAS